MLKVSGEIKRQKVTHSGRGDNPAGTVSDKLGARRHLELGEEWVTTGCDLDRH